MKDGLVSRVGRALVLALPLVAGLSLVGAQPASAVSGSGYNNTLPYETGCAAGAYVITSRAILGGTVSMVYSPRCTTNWVEWYGPQRHTTKTMVQPAKTSSETDTAGWSYSRQVYAPGATAARAEVWVWGNAAGTYAQGWSVRCSTTCSWVQFY